jgi:hypothetical protein
VDGLDGMQERLLRLNTVLTEAAVSAQKQDKLVEEAMDKLTADFTQHQITGSEDPES